MKLSPEHYAGLDKMARYFEHIEPFANHMQPDENTQMREFDKKLSHLTVAARRRQVFNAYHHDKGNSSIVNLNVIVNEKRF